MARAKLRARRLRSRRPVADPPEAPADDRQPRSVSGPAPPAAQQPPTAIRAIGVAGDQVRIAPAAFGVKEVAWSARPDESFGPAAHRAGNPPPPDEHDRPDPPRV